MRNVGQRNNGVKENNTYVFKGNKFKWKTSVGDMDCDLLLHNSLIWHARHSKLSLDMMYFIHKLEWAKSRDSADRLLVIWNKSKRCGDPVGKYWEFIEFLSGARRWNLAKAKGSLKRLWLDPKLLSLLSLFSFSNKWISLVFRTIVHQICIHV